MSVEIKLIADVIEVVRIGVPEMLYKRLCCRFGSSVPVCSATFAVAATASMDNGAENEAEATMRVNKNLLFMIFECYFSYYRFRL